MATTIDTLEYYIRARDEATAQINSVQRSFQTLGTQGKQSLEQISAANKMLQKETSTLTGFIRDQRTEQRQQNFLISQMKDVAGAAALGISIFGNTIGRGSEQMKKFSDSLNAGFVAFRGLDFALAAVKGPWGVAIAIVGGLAAMFVTLANTSEDAKKKLKEYTDEIASLQNIIAGLTLAEISSRKIAQAEERRLLTEKLNFYKQLEFFAQGGLNITQKERDQLKKVGVDIDGIISGRVKQRDVAADVVRIQERLIAIIALNATLIINSSISI